MEELRKYEKSRKCESYKKEYIVKRNLDSIKKDSENIEIFFKENKAKRIII